MGAGGRCRTSGWSGVGYRGAQLLERRGACRTPRGLVDAARQPDARVRVRERVHTVEKDARRSVKADPLGLVERLDQMAGHGDVRPLGRDHGEALLGDLPVRATFEVLQGDLHAPTLDLVPRYKVKG